MQKDVTSAIINSGDLAGSRWRNPVLSAIKGALLGVTTAVKGNILIADGYKWQSRVLSGDATLAATGAITLATVNSNVGTYNYATITVDAKGRITAASTGTVTAGTVTSVGVSTNTSYLTVGSSPVTSSGTITLNKTTGLTQNQVVATPDGTSGTADLRALVIGDMPANVKKRDIILALDGNGSAIAAGGIWYLSNVNFGGTITGWDVVADQVGSIVIDVWKANAAVPTVANTITASSLPTLTSAQSAFNGSVSGWTTSISAGDVFGFKVNSASTVTKVSLALRVTLT